MTAHEPIRQPELSELEAFVLAVEQGSITAAAARLRVSVPAAAKRIRQLEVLAQAPLLVRGRRGVTPTETGARLYGIARELLALRNRIGTVLAGEPAPDPLRIAGVHRLLGHVPAPPPEALVRNAEAVLAAVFHATGDALVITRAADGLIYEINEAAERLLGYEQQELRGRNVFDVDLWSDPDRRERCVQAAIATRTAQPAEMEVRTHDGEIRTVEARFEALELDGVPYILLRLRERSPARPPGSHAAGTTHPSRILIRR